MFTKFNRVLLASGLVLTSLVGFGSSAFAETGVVTAAMPAYRVLNFSTEGSVDITPNAASQGPTKFGTVSVESNTTWEITATSANGSQLKKGSDVIDYTFGIADSGKTAVELEATVGGDPVSVYVGGADGDGDLTEKNVNLTLGTTVNKPAGNYTDTITLTIAAQQ
jgi:hypothetical protein